MKLSLLDKLRCPETRQALHVEGAEGETVEEGWLVTADGSRRYPIRRGIPRFVPESGYADNFGMQWNHFSKTQLDSHSGHPISTERFWAATDWQPKDLRGQWVLDVGCGAGRFAEVALKAGAIVIALDYSTAVDAAQANLSEHPNLHVVQGDIYNLPFTPGSLSFIYSLGVLQHTPDVARAYASLPPLLAPGGTLVVDYYEKSYRSLFLSKYWLRPLTKRLPQQRLFATLEKITPTLLRVSDTIGRIPVAGRSLRRMFPVANYRGELPLNERQLHEWALLDTFDWLGPTYDSPQTSDTARTWAQQAGLERIEVLKAGHLVCRGRRAA